MCKKNLLLISLLSFWSVSLLAEVKDPTVPANYSGDLLSASQTETVSHFVLEAIIVKNENFLAIVNNKLVKAGDKIGDNIVKSIESNKVMIVGEQGEIVLTLFGDPIKEPTK